MEIITNKYGSGDLSAKALNDIAAIACEDCKDVFPVKDDFVKISLNKKKDLKVAVSVRIKKGVDIVKTCRKVQDSIKENIELMTGMDCSTINIDIQGFENTEK